MVGCMLFLKNQDLHLQSDFSQAESKESEVEMSKMAKGEKNNSKSGKTKTVKSK